MKTLMSMIDANVKPIGGNKKTEDIDEHVMNLFDNNIILYIIKVRFRRRDCTTWFHQITTILIDF